MDLTSTVAYIIDAQQNGKPIDHFEHVRMLYIESS